MVMVRKRSTSRLSRESREVQRHCQLVQSVLFCKTKPCMHALSERMHSHMQVLIMRPRSAVIRGDLLTGLSPDLHDARIIVFMLGVGGMCIREPPFPPSPPLS